MANDVGRPSVLEDEQFLLKIRDLVLEGLTEEKIQQALEIPKGTWDYWKWKNYEGFQDKLMLYRQQRKLILAEAVSDEVLTMSHMNGDAIDTGVLTQKVKESQFIRETLGKNLGYSKKTESDITSGGEKLVSVINIVKPHDNSNIQTTQETMGSVGETDGPNN